MKEAERQQTDTVGFHTDEVPGATDSYRQNGEELLWERGAGVAGSRYVMDPKLQFGEMEKFWKQRAVVADNGENVQHTTELCIQK